MEKIYFYIPDEKLIRNYSGDLENFWNFIAGVSEQWLPQSLAIGEMIWTIQTYLLLRSASFPCFLTSKWPEEGIVITHAHFLKRDIRPTDNRILVSIQSDKNILNLFAHFYIVQNREDPLLRFPLFPIFSSKFIRHWPQPFLIPRDPTRNDRFENIYYMGARHELYPLVNNIF